MTAAVQASQAAGVNPYPGLRPFEASEAHLFFGREKQTQELIDRLRKTRFLAVVGSSGSGKSSLVRAGLIPSLARQPSAAWSTQTNDRQAPVRALPGDYLGDAGSAWRTAVLRPGNNPIQNLAATLYNDARIGTSGAAAAMELGIVETALRSSSIGLSAVVQQSRLAPSENLLILVDQFEELFRYRSSDQANYAETTAAFVKLLLTAAADPLAPIHIVITMRADFLGSCAPYSGLPKAVSDGQFLVPFPSRQEMRRAIIQPAALAGCEIAQRLVVRLLNEAGEDPDQLPVLQHALMRSWEYWQQHHDVGEPLDFRHYEAIGTMRTALSQHADEAYSELNSPVERRIAEQSFRALVETDDKGRLIRRPTTIDDLASITGEAKGSVSDVLDHFRKPSRAFVVLRSDSFLDLSHESLIRVWTRLAAWAAAEAQAARFYLRLAASAKLNREGSESLWINPQLALGQKWRSETKPTVAWAQRYAPDLNLALAFLDASQQAVRRKFILRVAAIVSFIALLLFAVVVTYVDNQRLKSSLDSIRHNNSLLSGQIASYKNAAIEATDEISSLRAVQSSLTKDVTHLTVQCAGVASQVRMLHEQSDSLAIEEHDATDQRDAILDSLARAVSSNDNNVKSVSDLTAQNTSLVASLKAVNAENRALMTKIVQLEIGMPRMPPMRLILAASANAPMVVSAAASMVFKLPPDAELVQLLERNNKLLAESQQLSDANRKLANEAAALRLQNDRLRDLQADLREQLAKVTGEMKLLSSVNTLRTQQIADLKAVTAKLSAETAALNSDSLALGAIKTALNAMLDDMQSQSQLLLQTNAALSKAIQDAQSKK